MPTATAQSIRRKLVVAAAALIASSLVWSGGTFSSFDRTSSMPANTVTAGTVALSDNDGGTAVLSLSSAKPGDATTACVAVTYSGASPAQIRLYNTIGGTGLTTYLNLTVTRGTISGSPPAGSCTGFVADTTAWSANGAGVVYSGSLSSFPASTGSALADPNASATQTWTSGDRHVYKLTVTLPSGVSAAAQGLTGSAAFTWQAVST